MASTRIFVFGSNLAGRHGAGAARAARLEHGAVYGQGVGLQGQSYAIPTKDRRLAPLGLSAIRAHVREFMAFAGAHPETRFNVTRIGCGLAGFTDGDIAPMFAGAPENCDLPKGWREWGTTSTTGRQTAQPPACAAEASRSMSGSSARGAASRQTF